MFDPLLYCISTSYRKHRWVARNMWYFRTEAAFLYDRRTVRNKKRKVSATLDRIQGEGEKVLGGLLCDLSQAIEEYQKEMDKLSPAAMSMYNRMTATHGRVRNEAERKFSKNWDLIEYYKYEMKYKALYQKILKLLWDDEIKSIVDDIFVSIEAFHKVLVFQHKYCNNIPHKDRWLLESITGDIPYGYLRELITSRMTHMNELVFNKIKKW